MSAQSMTMNNINKKIVNHGILYVSCGTLGAGKSTWLKAHIKPEEKIISRDEIRFSIIKDNETYFSHEDEVFKKFIYEIKENIDNGINVYADATHLNDRSRGKLLYSLRKIGCVPSEINAIYFYTSLETCLRQNEYRKGTRAYVPEIQLKQMFHSSQAPEFREGFKNIWIVTEKGELMSVRK